MYFFNTVLSHFSFRSGRLPVVVGTYILVGTKIWCVFTFGYIDNIITILTSIRANMMKNMLIVFG